MPETAKGNGSGRNRLSRHRRLGVDQFVRELDLFAVDRVWAAVDCASPCCYDLGLKVGLEEVLSEMKSATDLAVGHIWGVDALWRVDCNVLV